MYNQNSVIGFRGLKDAKKGLTSQGRAIEFTKDKIYSKVGKRLDVSMILGLTALFHFLTIEMMIKKQKT